ncbi:MAG TPA: polysaccharide deacetylase family protein [Gaiellaceae bacterium]|nr:polysaccharide deacetylase family protein [Gaiellaceae bacterium]
MRRPLVLAYHGLGRVSRSLDPHNLMVPRESFVAQVERLRARGYGFVTLSEFARRLVESGLPEGVCALTFDDGSVDGVDVLPDTLEALGVPATVFVCPGLLGRPHPFLAPEAGIRLMDAAEIKQIAALPLFEIGSHTLTHADLSSAGPEQAYDEMASSKSALEELISQTVQTFAYPGCAYSSACPEAAERAGYLAAVTCGARGDWRPFELRRESVDSLDGRVSFALKSRGLFHPLAASPPGQLARRIARPFRHGPARSSAAERPDP